MYAMYFFNDFFITTLTGEGTNNIKQIREFLSPSDQKIIDDLTPDDNPVLVLFKMKEF